MAKQPNTSASIATVASGATSAAIATLAAGENSAIIDMGASGPGEGTFPPDQGGTPNPGDVANAQGLEVAQAGLEVAQAGLDAFVRKGPTVVVKGPAKGRWRIGRHFTLEPTSIQVDELDEAKWLALNSDPELLVTVVDPPD